MNVWEQWSALLVPHPNFRLFTGKKRLYLHSSSASRSSFVSDGDGDETQKSRKLTEPASPPPEIEPLSFEHEPMVDMTTNIFDFFPINDTSGVNDCTTLDGVLVSQSRGHAQNISPTIMNSDSSSFIALSMPSTANTATGQLESNSPYLDKCFFPNPLGYISRKLTTRRRTTRIPKSASTPLIPSEATPTIDYVPGSPPTTIPNLSSAKLPPNLSSPNPSCPPISAAINVIHSATAVTDNLILASSTIPPQHAPQSTFESSRFQTENGDSVPILSPATDLANPIALAPEISSACEQLPHAPHEYICRLDNSVHPHKPELASIIPAAITDVISEPGLWAPGRMSERAFSSQHLQPPGPSSTVEPSTRETDVGPTKRSSNFEFAAIPIASAPSGDMGPEENSNQPHNAMVIDDGTEILLLPTLNHSVVPASVLQQSQDLHNNKGICVAPSLSISPMMTTPSSSHGHVWSSSPSSGEFHTRDGAPSPSTSEEEGITTGFVMGTQELSPGADSKPVCSGFLSFAKWKWKKVPYSKSEEETVASDKSDPGVNQVRYELSTARAGGDGMSCSSKVNCEASQLIPSIPPDNSSEATAFTTPLRTIAQPEGGTRCPTETSVVAATNTVDDQYKPVRNKPKPKFIIGDLEDGAMDFPVPFTTTAVHDALENSNTATRLHPRHRGHDNPCGSRRWTLTSALTDEKISDAGLVKVLDRMRDDTKEQEDDGGEGSVALNVERVILEGWGIPGAEGVDGLKDTMGRVLHENPEHGHTKLCESPSIEYASYPLQTEASPSSNVGRGALPKTMKQHTRSRSTPSQAWITAQRALLTCRELILTERHYIAQLSALVQQDTATPPPPLMCDYAKELLRACERVLKGMENDPSARGVARAFLEREQDVQGAYIRWCGAVGAWFSGDSSGQDGSAPVGRLSLDLTEVGNRVRRLSLKRRSRVVSKTDMDKPAPPLAGSEVEDGSLKRTVSTWRKSVPSLGFETTALYGGGDRKEKESEREPATPSARRPAIRELAILPTQRVMRYVLIYQELLSHTPPTSPSRTFVERAAHAAARIAEKCDLAQGNAAFIASSPTNSNGGGSRSRNGRTGAETPPPVPPLPMTLVSAGRIDYDTVPASRSSVDSPSRSTQNFQPTNNKHNTELMTGPRRLSVSFMSLGWGKSNKQKIPIAAESMQVHTAAGVSSLTYPA